MHTGIPMSIRGWSISFRYEYGYGFVCFDWFWIRIRSYEFVYDFPSAEDLKFVNFGMECHLKVSDFGAECDFRNPNFGIDQFVLHFFEKTAKLTSLDCFRIRIFFRGLLLDTNLPLEIAFRYEFSMRRVLRLRLRIRICNPPPPPLTLLRPYETFMYT